MQRNNSVISQLILIHKKKTDHKNYKKFLIKKLLKTTAYQLPEPQDRGCNYGFD